VFTWAGDRWRHSIRIDGLPVATSLEHTADGRDPEWPASPPLVELSTVSVAAGSAILGVGRAGRSHYSASIVCHPSEPDTLLLELACRVPERPVWMGSTYEIAGQAIRIAAPPTCCELPATMRWAYSAGPAGLLPLPPGATTDGP